MTPDPTPEHGFSLIELAIVLVIVTLLSSGLMLGISVQREATTNLAAQQQLDSAREALLGFAITHGRLPCPADPVLANGANGAGLEDCGLSPSGHGTLPWATLGLPESDPWGQRLTYFASSKFTQPLTSATQCSFVLETGVAPDNSGTANVKLSASSGSNIASDLAAIIVSHGVKGAGAYSINGTKNTGASGDEAENADADLTFVARTGAGDFDDLLTWITPALLKSRLVAVGKLP